MTKSSEEIKELNERTNEVGLFFHADSFLMCAQKLLKDRPKKLQIDHPIEFLLYHSIELYLKSVLRAKRMDITVLSSREYGHNLPKLLDEIEARGFKVDEDDAARLRFVDAADLQIQARYISTGFKQVIPLDDLMSTARNIRSLAEKRLISSGVNIRPAIWLED